MSEVRRTEVWDVLVGGGGKVIEGEVERTEAWDVLMEVVVDMLFTNYSQ